MRIIEPGHVYALDNLDGEPGEVQTITFVNRRLGPHGVKHSGTLNQEVLRAAIDMLTVVADRIASPDAEMSWPGNAQAVKYVVDAQRLLRLTILPERTPVGPDGHFKL